MYKSPDLIRLKLTLPETLKGSRLDLALATLLPDHSRMTIQRWIREQHVSINGQKSTTPRDKVKGLEEVIICAPKAIQPAYEAEDMNLDIVFEDETLLIINKPAGLVVHPAPGHPGSTLLNALLHHAPALADLPRAGIVHRLDRETSGLLVIAKTQPALHSLTKQLRARTIKRIYDAVVSGTVISGGTVDAPIGRHPVQRKRMAVTEEGRPSVTHYRVSERFRQHTRLVVQLETGRTHQIRVHMAHVGFPLFGDPVYGGRLQLPKKAGPELILLLRGFRRQALHAKKLGLIHPITGKSLEFEAPLPEDLQTLIQGLRNDTKETKEAK